MIRIHSLAMLLILASTARADYEVTIPEQSGTLYSAQGQAISGGKLQIKYLGASGYTQRILATELVVADLEGNYTIPGRRFWSMRQSETFHGVEVSVLGPLVIPAVKTLTASEVMSSGLSALSRLDVVLPQRPAVTYYLQPIGFNMIQPFPAPGGLRR